MRRRLGEMSFSARRRRWSCDGAVGQAGRDRESRSNGCSQRVVRLWLEAIGREAAHLRSRFEPFDRS